MKDIKIKIRNSTHSMLVQKMLFSLGFSWGNKLTKNSRNLDRDYLYTNNSDNTITYGSYASDFATSPNVEVDFDWLLPETYDILIEGELKTFTMEELLELKSQVDSLL